MSHTFLQNDDIRLRPLEPGDLEVFYRMENDSEDWEFANIPAPYPRYVLQEYIRQTQCDVFADKQLRLMVERKGDAAVIGSVDLTDFQPLHQRAEVGITIAKAYRGQGYGKAALELLCDYCLTFLGMKQLTAHVATDNAASLELFRSLGFSQCGVLKEWWRCGEAYHDVAMLQKIGNKK